MVSPRSPADGSLAATVPNSAPPESAPLQPELPSSAATIFVPAAPDSSPPDDQVGNQANQRYLQVMSPSEGLQVLQQAASSAQPEGNLALQTSAAAYQEQAGSTADSVAGTERGGLILTGWGNLPSHFVTMGGNPPAPQVVARECPVPNDDEPSLTNRQNTSSETSAACECAVPLLAHQKDYVITAIPPSSSSSSLTPRVLTQIVTRIEVATPEAPSTKRVRSAARECAVPSGVVAKTGHRQVDGGPPNPDNYSNAPRVESPEKVALRGESAEFCQAFQTIHERAHGA